MNRNATALALATSALTGLGVVSPASGITMRAAEPASSTERGVVMECTGSRHGLDAYASLYENDLYGNTVQVVLDDDPARSASRRPQDVLAGGVVRAGVMIAGHRVRIRGSAHRVGRRLPVHEVTDDAGQHIVVDGIHRRLATDLVLRYAGTRVPLSCAPAFFYRLEVTRTGITGS